MQKLGGKGFGAVGTVRNFMNVVKEIDFEEVRERAEQRPRIMVVGPSNDAARTAAEAIFGSDAGRHIELRGGDSTDHIDAARYDAVVVSDPDSTGIIDSVKRNMVRSGSAKLFPISRAGNPEDIAGLRSRLLNATLDMAPSYGRHFPEFRAAAVKEIVDDTARANAQFALVSNIPAVIPILGGFVSASADLIVLTKNQVMMSYKIAAVHGRDLQDQTAVVRELVPVVGAGFLWRTIAREAVSFLPFAAGTVPKVVIAYAGTFSVGRAIDFYYRSGKKPNKEQLQAFVTQATETANRLGLPGRTGTDNATGSEQVEIDEKDNAANNNPS